MREITINNILNNSTEASAALVGSKRLSMDLKAYRLLEVRLRGSAWTIRVKLLTVGFGLLSMKVCILKKNAYRIGKIQAVHQSDEANISYAL